MSETSSSTGESGSGCPVQHEKSGSGCPVQHEKSGSGCPVQHEKKDGSQTSCPMGSDEINPYNMVCLLLRDGTQCLHVLL